MKLRSILLRYYPPGIIFVKQNPSTQHYSYHTTDLSAVFHHPVESIVQYVDECTAVLRSVRSGSSRDKRYTQIHHLIERLQQRVANDRSPDALCATYQLQHTVTPHSFALTNVDVNQDATLLVSGSYDRTAVVTSTSTGQKLLSIGGSEMLTDSAADSGHSNVVYTVAFSHGAGHLLATGSFDTTVRLHQLRMKENPLDGSIQTVSVIDTVVLTGHTAEVVSMEWSADNQYLVTTSTDCTLCVFKVDTTEDGQMLHTGNNAEESDDISVDSDDDTTKHDQQIESLAVKHIQTLHGHTAEVVCTATHVHGPAADAPQQLVIASGSFDSTVKLWVVEDVEHDNDSAAQAIDIHDCMHTLSGHAAEISCLQFSSTHSNPHCHSMLASGSIDGSVIIWDWSSGQQLHVIHHPDSRALDSERSYEVMDLQWSWSRHDDGQLLAVCYDDGNCVVYTVDSSTAKAAVLYTLPASSLSLALLSKHNDASAAEALHCSFSGSGQKLATGSSDGTIRVWSMQTGEMLQELQTAASAQAAAKSATAEVLSLHWSYDSTSIVAATKDNRCKIWSVHSGT